MAQLDLDTRVTGESAEITVRGEIDMATAPQLRSALDGLLADGCHKIVVDCRGLEFLDSSGIGVLVSVRERLGDDGEISLWSPPAHVRKVLELTGVAEMLMIRD